MRMGLPRGRRDRPGPARGAPARRRPPLRGPPRLGRPPAGARRRQGPAPAPTTPASSTACGARRRCCARSRTRCCCARFGAALDGARPHLVLEHIEGPRLSTLMRRYGMDLEQLLPLALNLCAVLHYLAHEGVVHLDVKPQQHHHGRRAAADRPQHRAPDRGARRALTGRHRPLDGARAARPRALRRDRPGLRRLGPRRHPARLLAPTACRRRWSTRRRRLPRRPARPTARPRASSRDALEPLVDALPAPRLGRFRPSPRRRTPTTRRYTA